MASEVVKCTFLGDIQRLPPTGPPSIGGVLSYFQFEFDSQWKKNKGFTPSLNTVADKVVTEIISNKWSFAEIPTLSKQRMKAD